MSFGVLALIILAGLAGPSLSSRQGARSGDRRRARCRNRDREQRLRVGQDASPRSGAEKLLRDGRSNGHSRDPLICFRLLDVISGPICGVLLRLNGRGHGSCHALPSQRLRRQRCCLGRTLVRTRQEARRVSRPNRRAFVGARRLGDSARGSCGSLCVDARPESSPRVTAWRGSAPARGWCARRSRRGALRRP
jgi:hypothetical protein